MSDEGCDTGCCDSFEVMDSGGGCEVMESCGGCEVMDSGDGCETICNSGGGSNTDCGGGGGNSGGDDGYSVTSHTFDFTANDSTETTINNATSILPNTHHNLTFANNCDRHYFRNNRRPYYNSESTCRGFVVVSSLLMYFIFVTVIVTYMLKQ